MNTKKFSILLAALMLILVQLACAVGELSLENPRMSKDDTGDTPVSTFVSSDTFFVVADLNNAVAGTFVEAKWYLVSAEGYDAGPIETNESNILTITEESFTGTVSFSLFSTGGGWPAGQYQVELYLNGVLSQTVNFTVQ